MVDNGCHDPLIPEDERENININQKLNIEDTFDDETKKIIEELDNIKYDRPPLNVTVVSRKEWKAIPYDKEDTNPLPEMDLPLYNVLVTHTGTPSCDSTEKCKKVVKNLQRHHIALGYPDIIYNFLIGGDGKVYEGRGWKLKGGVTFKYNESFGPCLKIAHIGYFGDHSTAYMDNNRIKLQFDFIETGMEKNYVAYNATMIPDYNTQTEYG